MLDFIVALAQFACFLGLVYGAFLCLAHHDCVDELRAHYDPIAGHDWMGLKPESRELRISVVELTRDEARQSENKLAA